MRYKHISEFANMFFAINKSQERILEILEKDKTAKVMCWGRGFSKNPFCKYFTKIKHRGIKPDIIIFDELLERLDK